MKAKLVLASALGVFLLSIFFLPPVASQTYQQEPSRVKVGVWINSIEKVDTPAQTFSVDFYLWFKYHDIKPDIEFLRGTPRMDLVTEEERPTENYIEYRVRGAYVQPFDFRDFPLDEHFLSISLEDKNHDITELVFEPDLEESGIDPSLSVAGWDVKDFRIYVSEHAYPDETYSQLTFGLTVYRSKISAVLKNFLPIIIITLISLLTFAISIKNFGQRVGICVSTLMSAVAYHIAALSGLPALGYLTLFDRIMLVVYTVFLYNLLVSVQGMRLVEAGKVEEAEKFESRMQNLLPVLVVVLGIIYIWLFGMI
ncbi:MAG: hypothetical protein APZ16_03585 [Candidatus Hadarchaeum yellowstonense]|uniref:Neurotransmitter-gated ion-channel ligand-binding domain-containing protein n=1 Tax=Hadarchaeum yellowstonense TaxID=1776334 RepID=A0A147JZJ6_HADYE|nr:MAG: hypothetical protein APZ16_03585 [Candidatus Hadarchaeum yellowstonense]